MQRNTLFSILATAALGLVMAGPVNAENYSWKGSNTNDDYHTASNWSPSGGPPGTGDKATINPASQTDGYKNPVLDDQDRLLGELVIGSGFSLTVTGVKLTLEGNTHTFNGPLILSNSTAKVEFTFAQTSGWVDLTGSGGIEGKHASAEVRLNNSKIDSVSVIHGMMIVKEVGGTATFKNGTTGKVLANVSGTLQFASGLTLESESGSSFEARSNPNAELEFNQAATTNMLGDFVLCGDATIDFNAAIDTTGCFDEGAANGWIRVAGADYFCYDDDDCGGPSTDGNCWSSDHEFTGSCS